MKLAHKRLAGGLAIAVPGGLIVAEPAHGAAPGVPLGLLGVDVGSLVTKAVKAAIDALFGDLAGTLGENALRVLLVYPDFTQEGEYGHLQAAVAQTAPIAYALVAFCALLGFAHGLATGGADGGLDAAKRFVGAFVGIWAWPWLYAKALAGANLFFTAMAGLPMVKQSVGQGLELAVIPGAPLGLMIGPIVAVLLLVVLGTKIAAVALLSVVFVGAPFALAVFPYPPLSHLTGALFQTLGAVLALPFVWSILVVVFAATGKGALTLDGAGVADNVTAPLVAMTLLVMMICALPFLLRRGHAAGLLPSLRGSGATLASRGLPARVGASEIAQRAGAHMTQAAAPPVRAGGPAADGVPMDFAATTRRTRDDAPAAAGVRGGSPYGAGGDGAGARVATGSIGRGASTGSGPPATSGDAEPTSGARTTFGAASRQPNLPESELSSSTAAAGATRLAASSPGSPQAMPADASAQTAHLDGGVPLAATTEMAEGRRPGAPAPVGSGEPSPETPEPAAGVSPVSPAPAPAPLSVGDVGATEIAGSPGGMLPAPPAPHAAPTTAPRAGDDVDGERRA